MLPLTQTFKKPFVAIWQTFMTDTPKVLDRITRNQPGIALGQPEGYSYAVLIDGRMREVFALHDSEVGGLDYRYLHFVALGSEGDNFYNTARKNRFTAEPVPEALRTAIQEYDNNPNNFKKKLKLNPAEPKGAAAGSARCLSLGLH
ncbi:MAG: hypothetical protein KGI37_03045 [Alphaproteobacteria bacterium]|nr:hypothetical protein [Alphaproteobacteria bacterium]